MSDLAEVEAEWGDWIRRACQAVGVEPELVEVTAIHALTKQIAHRSVRPMAPVGSFILGVALGRAGEEADRATVHELAARIEGILPPPGQSGADRS